MGALRRRAVPAAAQAAGRMPRRARHHRGALPARQGRPGARRALQRGGEILQRLFAATRAATTTCASRTSPSTARTPRPRIPAATFRWPRCATRAARGRIGSVAPRFHGLPTNRSQRVDARGRLPGDRRALPGRWRRRRDPGAQLPGLPPERQPRRPRAGGDGIATVVMGCAKDIVEHVGVPRLLFSDFPLGNAAGRPRDPALAGASRSTSRCSVLETAPAPRTTVQSPLRWSDNPDWKLDYCNIERLSPRRSRAPRRVRQGEGCGEGGA